MKSLLHSFPLEKTLLISIAESESHENFSRNFQLALLLINSFDFSPFELPMLPLIQRITKITKFHIQKFPRKFKVWNSIRNFLEAEQTITFNPQLTTFVCFRI